MTPSGTGTISLILADDHAVVRRGIREFPEADSAQLPVLGNQVS